VLGDVEDFLNVFAFFGGDEGDGGVVDVLEFFVEVLAILLHEVAVARGDAAFCSLGLHLFAGEVPLVDDDDDGLVLLGDVLGELLSGSLTGSAASIRSRTISARRMERWAR